MRNRTVLLDACVTAILHFAAAAFAQVDSAPEQPPGEPARPQITLEARWVAIEDTALPSTIALPKLGAIEVLSDQQLESLSRAAREKSRPAVAASSVTLPVGSEGQLAKTASVRVVVRPESVPGGGAVRLQLKIQNDNYPKSLAAHRSLMKVQAPLGKPALLHVMTTTEVYAPSRWDRLFGAQEGEHTRHMFLIVTPTIAAEEPIVAGRTSGHASVK